MENIEYLKKYLSKEEFKENVGLLEKGIPVQYIVGNVDFYGNIIKVNKNVLIPRFETELLVEKTVSYVRKLFDGKVSILEIGTGSGCIAITLKKLLECEIMACDISKEALKVARENSSFNNTDIDFVCSDVFSNIDSKFDIIISNPPYIAYDEEIDEIVKNNEPLISLYALDNGLYFYKKILKECSSYLNDIFLIAFEIGYKQGDAICKIANDYLKDFHIIVEKDYSNRDRYVFIWN